MSFKDYRKRQKIERHKRLNSSKSSKWLMPTGILAGFLLIVAAAGYVFPAGWNSSFGQISGLSMQERPFRLGLDLLGGTHLVYQADLSDIPIGDRRDSLNGVRDVIERRVNAFGVSEPVVQTTKSGDDYRIIVELAGVSDVNEAIKLIGETPVLEFKIPNTGGIASAELVDSSSVVSEDGEGVKDGKNVDDGNDTGAVDEDKSSANKDVVSADNNDDGAADNNGVDEDKSSGDDTLVASVDPSDFWTKSDLGGAQLKRSGVEFDQNTGTPYVTLVFDSEGADLFAEMTKTHVGQQIAIFLDGEIISAPTVQAAIYGGEAIITGSDTLDEARLLAQRLNAGALPVPINLISQQTIGPTLGAISLSKSLYAGMIGLLLIGLFMILYYRLPGILSVGALSVYSILVLSIFKFLPVTLTLSGLAGFILSIGMAVDANVLIFERLKEEIRAGRSLERAIDEGFKRAWTSIRDGNITTLIACGILYWLSSSFIQGFALTLAIGVLMSMFSAITVSRVLLMASIKVKFFKRLSLYGVKED